LGYNAYQCAAAAAAAEAVAQDKLATTIDHRFGAARQSRSV